MKKLIVIVAITSGLFVASCGNQNGSDNPSGASNANTTDNAVIKNLHEMFASEILIRPSGGGQSYVSTATYEKGRSYYTGMQQNFAKLENYYGKPIHVAVQVQKERMRIWLGEEKVFDAPKVMVPSYSMNQLFIKVSGSSYQESQVGL